MITFLFQAFMVFKCWIHSICIFGYPT